MARRTSHRRYRTPAAAGLLAVLLGVAGAVVAKEGLIQCANLVYGGFHTSRCFSDEFLSALQRDTTIATERRFRSVKLASDELFEYPFVVMTGEQSFHFTPQERENLKRYLSQGGFLLASAGCSSGEWDRAFRQELKAVLGSDGLQALSMDHPLFHTVHDIAELKLAHGGEPPSLEGVTLNGKVVLVYSRHGLNDTEHTEGCCCCGGNEIRNAMDVNVNILAYALLH